VPTVSRFYGIVIFMNYREHAPPHFHARYQEYEVTVDIQTGVVRGAMPKRALGMIFEWMALYQGELLENWDRAQRGSTLHPIPPFM
jgi:hypothetical protein